MKGMVMMFGRILYTLRGKHCYCGKCGTRLQRFNYIRKFNRKTGLVDRREVHLKCPNYFENIWNDDNGHDCYKWIEKVKKEGEL
jgi:hypothetical protein